MTAIPMIAVRVFEFFCAMVLLCLIGWVVAGLGPARRPGPACIAWIFTTVVAGLIYGYTGSTGFEAIDLLISRDPF